MKSADRSHSHVGWVTRTLQELGVDVEKYKTDPDLADFWADLEANGPAAAMRYVPWSVVTARN